MSAQTAWMLFLGSTALSVLSFYLGLRCGIEASMHAVDKILTEAFGKKDENTVRVKQGPTIWTLKNEDLSEQWQKSRIKK